MKTANMAIMSVAIMGIGLLGITSVSFNDVSQASPSSYSESTGMLGHMTAIHKDPNGNILKYVQGDNVVVEEADQGMAHIIFGSQNSTDGLAVDEAFNTIGLYDYQLGTPSTTTTFANVDAADFTGALLREAVTVNDGTTGTNCADRYNGNTAAGLQRLQCTFTSDQTAVVYGAYITNNGTADTLFAAKNFTGGEITLNSADQLTIAWEITITP